jgi:hypothetical protein
MKTFFAGLTARMRRLFAALIVCTSALIAACGGGGGGGDFKPPIINEPPPVQVERTDLLFGYFGVDGPQIAETADHVNVLHVPDWGPWADPAVRTFIGDRMIAQMQEADARGIKKFVVMVGVFVFDTSPNGTHDRYTYRGIDELLAFKNKLAALGLLDNVVALYPVDEPELHDLSDAALTFALAQIRAVWPEAKLAVCYGDTGRYPALAAYDWIGIDNYGAGAGVLNQLPALRPGQHHIVVPGASEPWKHDPAPFMAYANAHPEVVWVMPFVWFDGLDGHYKGARSNGMAETYRAAGRKATGK